MVAEGEAFNPHDLTLFYHVAVLAWTQFSSTENVSFSIGPLGIWASKLGMFGGLGGVVASAQKGTTPWTVKSLPIFISEKECLWGEIKSSISNP